VRLQAELLRGARRQLDLLDRPGLAGLGLALDRGRREGVELLVEGGMDGDQLTLQVGGQLGDLQAMLGDLGGQVVAVGLRLGGLGQIDDARVPARQLHTDVAELGSPGADRVEAVEGRLVAHELCEEESGAFNHGIAPGVRG